MKKEKCPCEIDKGVKIIQKLGCYICAECRRVLGYGKAPTKKPAVKN